MTSKKLRYRTKLVICLCVALLAICVAEFSLQSSAMGQAAVARPETPDVSILSFRLKYIPPQEAVMLIGQLIPEAELKLTAVPRLKTLMARGNQNQLGQLRETIELIDAPTADDKQVKIFRVQNSNASTLANVVTQLAQANDTRVAVDMVTNSLLAQGSEENLAVIGAVLEQLDKSQETTSAEEANDLRTVEVFWLMESGREEAGGVSPNPRIRNALDELTKQGFAQLLQVGHVRVSASSGSKFRLRSSTGFGPFQIEGNLSAGKSGTYGLSITLEAGGNETEELSLSTQITTVPQHNVILAIANGNPHDQSGRSVFVLRID